MSEIQWFKVENGPVILMADDDEDDCMIAVEAFKESKIPGSFLCVEDGVALFEYLSGSGKYSNAGAVPPALILLDLNMPRKTGRQALAEMKNDPDLKDIPVVILTTSREERDVSFCMKMGAKGFVTKPPLFSEWVDLMNSLVKTWLRKTKPSPDQ